MCQILGCRFRGHRLGDWLFGCVFAGGLLVVCRCVRRSGRGGGLVGGGGLWLVGVVVEEVVEEVGGVVFVAGEEVLTCPS